MNKKEKVIIGLLVVIIVILGGVCVYLFLDKPNDNNSNSTNEVNNSNNTENTNNQETPEENKIYEPISIDFECYNSHETCTKKVDGYEISVVVGEDTYNQSLVINGKKIYEDDYYIIDKVMVIDNNFIVKTGGTDVYPNYLYIYDKDGNLIKEISDNFDKNYPAMRLAINSKIENNEIIFEGSRMYHGPELIMSDDFTDNVKFYDENGVSNLERCTASLEQYKNEVINGEYKIKYLGNGKFSNVEAVSYKKVGEVITCN